MGQDKVHNVELPEGYIHIMMRLLEDDWNKLVDKERENIH